MYDPKIQYGYDMYRDLFNKHGHELYYIELKFDKISYGDGYEQIVPNIVAEFKR